MDFLTFDFVGGFALGVFIVAAVALIKHAAMRKK